MPHPRGYGNNARVLGEYVRRRQVISLEEAVRKMTSLPAQHFRFDGRGQIKQGYFADIAIFDAGDGRRYRNVRQAACLRDRDSVRAGERCGRGPATATTPARRGRSSP